MYSAASPVLTIEQTNPVKLLINISENYYKSTKKGMPVEIKLDAYDEEQFDGKVTIVYPTIDATTHTFPVEITINNTQQKVRPGMFARATINFGDQNHVIVPDEALVKQIGAGDRYVYVYKNGKVSYNKVVLGKHMGSNYEIISGVEPGEQVVIAGQSRLANGKEVEVVK
jgi:RND family efflux transporter MFP subunit